MTSRGRQRGWKVAVHLMLLPFLLFALFPFYHMTLTSLKQDRELYDRQASPLVIRQGATLQHYTKLLWESAFLTWTKNSLLVTILATTLVGGGGHHRGLCPLPDEILRGQRLRHGDLRHLPGADVAALPCPSPRS